MREETSGKIRHLLRLCACLPTYLSLFRSPAYFLADYARQVYLGVTVWGVCVCFVCVCACALVRGARGGKMYAYSQAGRQTVIISLWRSAPHTHASMECNAQRQSTNDE